MKAADIKIYLGKLNKFNEKEMIMSKKFIITLLFAVLFLAPSNFVFAGTGDMVTVTGGATTATGANGDYYYAGTTNVGGTNRDFYDKPSSVYRIEFRYNPTYSVNEWEVWESTALGGSGVVRFYHTSTSAAIPVGAWLLDVASGSPYVTFTPAPVATPPTVTTNSASSIGTSGASLNGTVNANLASTTVTFQYGLTTSYGSSVTADQSPLTGSTATAVSKGVTGLTPNTLYHYRAVGVNSAGTTYGSDATFTTNALPPSVATEYATGVSSESAVMNGIINANGVSTTVTFEYGLTIAYGTSVTADQSPVTGTSDTPVTKTLSGLASGTTYHFRSVGSSAGGTTNGFDKTFTTAPGIPINVAISSDGSEVTISWDAVTGATSYKVYSSADPYSGFVLNTTGTFNGVTWTAPNSGSKLFYYVLAVN